MIRTISAAALGLALAGAAAAEDVAYEVGGEPFAGYFAAAEDPRGLVVIVHDWDGMGDYEMRRADMLAELGYDAFALDMYGAGQRPETTEARIAATRAVFADPERLEALVAGGLAAARERSDAGATVVMGYCFGGTVAMTATQAGAAGDVEGWASFHGNFPGGEDWPAEVAPVLIMHGGADDNPSMADVTAFLGRLEAAGQSYELEVYSGAPHAFTVFDSERYRERADALSWATFQRFLEERIDGAAS